MKDNKRLALVWDTIERLAFVPRTDKDCKIWLGVYARSLHKLWDLPEIFNYKGSTNTFNISFLNLKCDYNTIDHKTKYSVYLRDLSACRNYWQSEIDPCYLSRISLDTVHDNYPKQKMDKCLIKDIIAVLDGMIFHPRCHTHMDEILDPPVLLDQ